MIKTLFKLFILLISVTGLSAAWYWNDYNIYLTQPINIKVEQSVVDKTQALFTVKKGDLVVHIADKLHQQGIISRPFYFRLYARLSDNANKIKAGEYRLKEAMTIVDLVNLFVSGKVYQYSLTIVEGWTSKETLQAIAKNSQLLHSEAEALDETALKKYLHSEYASLEGLFYPDTYFFPQGTSDLQFLKRSYGKMQQVVNEEWQKRDKNIPLKSAYEALILASIVEKESGISSERSKIAGVFIRRMKKKMRLQSDPTIIYGMGVRYKGNIRRRDINEKTAYNTYQISRLPPTPIALAGREAIHAVLHPDKGKSLYFVADGTGGHVFTGNLKDHNRAVRKYLLKKK